MMRCFFRTVIITILFCLYCVSAKGQLSFAIDSVFCVSFDSFREGSWERAESYHRGPDIIVYGRLINQDDSPVILEFSEEKRDGDSFLWTFYKQLQLYISYHYKKNYYFAIDPLIVTDYMSYPYWDGNVLPENSYTFDGGSVFVSIISPHKSIPLAFETLAKPNVKKKHYTDVAPNGSCRFRNQFQTQKRIEEAIMSTLEVFPVVEDEKEIPDFLLRQLDSLRRFDDGKPRYDENPAIPESLLDKKPLFIDGGKEGFCLWLKNRMVELPASLTKKWNNLLVLIIVNKEGQVIDSRIITVSPGAHDAEADTLMKAILIESPRWAAGEIHGKKVDSMIGLSMSFDTEGGVTVNFIH